MRLLIERISSAEDQTTGFMHVLGSEDEILFGCCTLELAWKKNQRNISCIPVGNYEVKKRYSAKFKDHFHITNVAGRSYILIHAGNFYTQIRGCILVGSDFKDINGDGLLDVIESKDTMETLLEILPDKFQLEIIS